MSAGRARFGTRPSPSRRVRFGCWWPSCEAELRVGCRVESGVNGSPTSTGDVMEEVSWVFGVSGRESTRWDSLETHVGGSALQGQTQQVMPSKLAIQVTHWAIGHLVILLH
jgi:hypothetical protein